MVILGILGSFDAQRAFARRDLVVSLSRGRAFGLDWHVHSLAVTRSHGGPTMSLVILVGQLNLIGRGSPELNLRLDTETTMTEKKIITRI